MFYVEWCMDKKSIIGIKCIFIVIEDLENKILFGFVLNDYIFFF